MFQFRSFAAQLVASFLPVSPTSAQLTFEDVSEEAGVDLFTYVSSSYHDLGINWIDFDNDYDANLFVVTSTGGGRQEGSLGIASNDPDAPMMDVAVVGASDGPSLDDRINPARGRMRRTPSIRP